MKITKTFQQIAMAAVLLGFNSYALADTRINQKKNGTPPALGDKSPPYNNPDRFVIQGSFIYWQADSEGFELGTSENLMVTGSGTPDFIVDAQSNLKEQNMHFDWDPGFKAGIGAVFGDRDQWDMLLNWTWLRSKGDASQTGVEAQVVGGVFPFDPTATGVLATADILAPEWITVNPGAPLSYPYSSAYHTQGNWSLHYNTIDLEFGRNFFLGKSLTLRVHGGARAARILQKTNVTYDLNTLNTLALVGSAGTAQLLYDTSVVKGKNEYEGIGLRGGLDVNWNFAEYFCLFAKASGSILYGPFDIDQSMLTTGVFTETTGMTDINSPFNIGVTYNDNVHKTRTSLQAIFGFTFHGYMNKDKAQVFFNVGYEVNQWFQQNQMRNITGSAVQSFVIANGKNGDLGLHGLTADLRFEF